MQKLFLSIFLVACLAIGGCASLSVKDTATPQERKNAACTDLSDMYFLAELAVNVALNPIEQSAAKAQLYAAKMALQRWCPDVVIPVVPSPLDVDAKE